MRSSQINYVTFFQSHPLSKMEASQAYSVRAALREVTTVQKPADGNIR
jgi:hypothetical protein